MAKPRLWAPLLAAFLLTLTDSANLKYDAFPLNVLTNRQNKTNAVGRYLGQFSSSNSKQYESFLRTFSPNKTNSNNAEAQLQTRYFQQPELMDLDEIYVRKVLKKLDKKGVSKTPLKSPAKSQPKGKAKRPSKKPAKVIKRKQHKKPVMVKKFKGKKGRTNLLRSKKNGHNKKRNHDFNSDEENNSIIDSVSTDEDDSIANYHPYRGFGDYETDRSSSSSSSDNSRSSSSNERSLSRSGGLVRKVHSYSLSSSSSSRSKSDSDYTDENDNHHRHHRGRCGFLGCGKPSTRQRATALLWQGVKSTPTKSALTARKKKPNHQRAGLVSRG